MSDDLTEIKISTARIEEQVKALSNATSLQHKNLSEQMDKLAGKESMADLEMRVATLEKAHGWVIKGVFATAATAVATATGGAGEGGIPLGKMQ